MRTAIATVVLLFPLELRAADDPPTVLSVSRDDVQVWSADPPVFKTDSPH